MKTKKELKEAYRQIKPRMGVFRVRNKVNGKVLIEGSTGMVAKWNRYQMELKLGNHRNTRLQEDWNEFGEENFVFEVLSEIGHDEKKDIDYRQEVKVLEEMHLEEAQPFEERGYNKRIK